MAFVQPACEKCGAILVSHLFCFSCNIIQTFPGEINYFETLGIPLTFEVNSTELEESYQNLSLELHPDFYSSAPESEKRLSESATAILNTAYNSLKEPTSRAKYLVHLLSKNIKLDEGSLPEGFLGEMFFLQEELDEMLESGKDTAFSEMWKDLLKRQKNIEEDYAPLFKEYEDHPEDPKILQQLQTHLNAERYLRRLLERITANN